MLSLVFITKISWNCANLFYIYNWIITKGGDEIIVLENEWLNAHHLIRISQIFVDDSQVWLVKRDKISNVMWLLMGNVGFWHSNVGFWSYTLTLCMDFGYLHNLVVYIIKKLNLCYCVTYGFW